MTHIFVDEVHARSTDIDGVRLYLLRLNLLCHASYSPGARTLNGVRLSADGAARPPLALTLTPTLTLPLTLTPTPTLPLTITLTLTLSPQASYRPVGDRQLHCTRAL